MVREVQVITLAHSSVSNEAENSVTSALPLVSDQTLKKEFPMSTAIPVLSRR